MPRRRQRSAAEVPTIEIDGRGVGWGSGGVEWRQDRPTLLLIHGAGSDHSVWALQARSLAQAGWNVLAPDLPGHGQSKDMQGLESIAGYAAWVGRLLDALDCDRVAVAGHSMGACIALELAAARPDSIAALAVVGAGDSLPVNPSLLADCLERPLRAHAFIAAFGHGRASRFGGAEAPGIWMLGTALALLSRCEPAVLHRDFAACNDWRGAEVAVRVACPTLVLSGAGDRMTPPRAGKALAARIDGARFEIIENSGHMMMSEAPNEVSAALRRFLPTVEAVGEDGGAPG